MASVYKRLKSVILLLALPVGCIADAIASAPHLASIHSVEGYVARLLINETAFPGETLYVSEADSLACQEALLCVLRNRLHHIPEGYAQQEVAAARARNVYDIITAGGYHGQVEGFYRDAHGSPTMARRVTERVDYLLLLARRQETGRIARLLGHASTLAAQFASDLPRDRFAELRQVNGVRVTGYGYGWMTDQEYYHPGGHFVRITDACGGGLGGNRFFTLRKRP